MEYFLKSSTTVYNLELNVLSAYTSAAEETYLTDLSLFCAIVSVALFSLVNVRADRKENH